MQVLDLRIYLFIIFFSLLSVKASIRGGRGKDTGSGEKEWLSHSVDIALIDAGNT